MTTKSPAKMSTFMATIVGMNAMIGAGIFTIPEQLQRTVGPAALLTYAFVIGAVWSIAYSLSRVAYHYPQEGSFYTYIQAWAGKKVGLAAAFLYCTGLVVALGLLTYMTGIYLYRFFPQLSPQILGSIALGILVFTILAGTKILHWGQIVLIIFTILPLAVITVLCLSKADVRNLTPFMPYGPQAIFRAARIVIFGFFGFESVAALHALVAHPTRTVPRAITASIIAVSIVYVTFILATLLGIPRAMVLQGGTLPDFLYKLFPTYSWLITLINWGIIITIMGTIHSMIWSVGTLLQSLTRMTTHSFYLSSRQATLILSFFVWLSSIMFKSLDLFFNIAALCIIIALTGAIWPLASNMIPSTKGQRMIAWAGIVSAFIMCTYALEGIWKHMLS